MNDLKKIDVEFGIPHFTGWRYWNEYVFKVPLLVPESEDYFQLFVELFEEGWRVKEIRLGYFDESKILRLYKSVILLQARSMFVDKHIRILCPGVSEQSLVNAEKILVGNFDFGILKVSHIYRA